MARRIKLADLPIGDLLALSTMSLATVSSQGEVHSAAVYFAVGEHVEFYFFSAPDSQHSLDVDQNPRSAVTIYPETSEWENIRGLQMRGEVFKLESGLRWDQAWKIYSRKFPFVGGMQAVVEQNQFYAFHPHWIRLVDNRRGFGFKQEWTLP